MKKFYVCIMMVGCLALATSCDEERVLTPEQMPKTIHAYIIKNYPGANISFVKEEKEWFKTKYKVQLDNRIELEFNADGVPTDVDLE